MTDKLDLTALEEWQDGLVARGALPCAVTQVTRGGKTEFLRASGWSNVGAKIPVQEDSIFRLYSMSKPIVSIALMTLYEEGRFQLNEPIYRYLGDQWKKDNMVVFDGWIGDEEEGRKNLKYATVASESDITMGQVLTHTAGLSYGFDPSGRGIPVDRIYGKKMRHPLRTEATIARDDISMLQAFCDALAEMPLHYQPGTHWNYSYATDVCGRLIEVLSVQYSETSKNGGSFGLGFAIIESPQAAGLIGSVGSFAWGGAAATIFWCDPVEDLHVVFCTQVMGMQPPNMLRAKLASFVYGALGGVE